MAHGISLFHDARRVALKWHRLRRRGNDPLFSSENLEAGLRLGASMEIDLRVTGDCDFAVLHDGTLERETNGSGNVCERTSGELAGLCYDDSGAPGMQRQARSILMLDDLAALVRRQHR